MREIPSALAASLAAPLTSLAYLWRVDRPDGIALGFTTHDRPIRLDGLLYRPGPGMRPSAIVQEAGADAESAEVSGILSHRAISRADLHAGRYDGAAVALYLIDWRQPGAGSVLMMSGTLGAVRAERGGFTADLETAAAGLSRIPAELTTPECRAVLGDARCQVDLARHRRSVRIAAVEGARALLVDADLGEDAFSYGAAMPLSGALSGRRLGIARAAGPRLVLEEDAPGIAAGDRLQLTAGCDRRFATCRDRFRNQNNFRGEPHVPGRDSAMRYPGL